VQAFKSVVATEKFSHMVRSSGKSDDGDERDAAQAERDLENEELFGVILGKLKKNKVR
jgi:hypothetical protein